MPPIGYFITSKFDFSSLYYDLSGQYNNLQDAKAIEEALKSGAPLILYGQFITDFIQFLIVAFVVFLIARWGIKLFKSMEAEKALAPEVELLTEIRDLLKTGKSV